jgi:hypothetical protein
MLVLQTTATTGSPETAEALQQQENWQTACTPVTAKAPTTWQGANNNQEDKQQ